MASEVLLATRSHDKAGEIVEILSTATAAKLITLTDLGMAATPAEDEVEQHETFVENALAKGVYFARESGRLTLADDSGLMVDALGGLPGVRTKRFAADHGVTSDNTDEANNDLLLDKLSGIPDAARSAQYVCAAALVWPDGDAITAIGTCSGVIMRERRGRGGFGYDPLFLIPDLQRTFAELTRAEKNARSHRARAFRALAAHLR